MVLFVTSGGDSGLSLSICVHAEHETKSINAYQIVLRVNLQKHQLLRPVCIDKVNLEFKVYGTAKKQQLERSARRFEENIKVIHSLHAIE